jgi:hypothetical protein
LTIFVGRILMSMHVYACTPSPNTSQTGGCQPVA